MAAAENASNLSHELDPLFKKILAITEQSKGDGGALLEILRQIEDVHRQICEEKFYPALPERRRDLYNLLRDMEEEGGWPYIPRPKLKDVLKALLDAEKEACDKDSSEEDLL